MKKFTTVLIVCMAMVFGFIGIGNAANYNEAPMLSRLVEAGELPPVEERLPDNPMVITPVDQVGQYGGVWRKFLTNVFPRVQHDTLVRRMPYEGNEMVANLAEAWEESECLTTFTFHLRQGVKWSDGEPFTSEDIMFWFEDVVLNRDLTPAVPAELRVRGEVGKVTAPDEWTVVFEFPGAHPTFMNWIVNLGNPMAKYPKHYLKQYHPAYTDQAVIDAQVRAENYDSWFLLFSDKANSLENPDRPVIHAWKITTRPGDQLQVAVRNPYYWKVDTEGNQLPYIDRLEWENITDQSVRTLRAMAGQVDLAEGFQTADFPILKMNEAEGGYRTLALDAPGLSGAALMSYVNQNFQGEAKMAELLQNVMFRRALSVAINRDEVNEFVALGLAETRQSVLSDMHPAGDPAFSQAYTEYDPATANKWLDEIGLDKRDSDGYRTYPDGSRLLLILTPFGTDGRSVDGAEIIRGHFDDVGIRTVVRPEERSLWIERVQAGEHQISVYANSNGMDPWGRPRWYIPVSNSSFWAPLNGLHYATGGTAGIPAEGYQLRLQEIYDAGAFEPDEDVRNALAREAMELHSQNLWQIGIIAYPPWPVVKSNAMKNVPEWAGLNGWNAFHNWPEQYYLDR